MFETAVSVTKNISALKTEVILLTDIVRQASISIPY